jgi:hypothetical protein
MFKNSLGKVKLPIKSITEKDAWDCVRHFFVTTFRYAAKRQLAREGFFRCWNAKIVIEFVVLIDCLERCYFFMVFAM